MRIDPSANRILIDYVAMTDKFGFLDFGRFIAAWHAADAVTTALGARFDPEQVPELLMRLDG